jgi:hypothetical protein
MNRGSWGISLVICWCLAATCLAAPEEEITGPRLIMNERFFNFQEVREGEVIEHTFALSNGGSETLVIEEVKPG